MSADSRCPNCRNAVPPGNSYCGSCGLPVAPSSALPTVNIPPPSHAGSAETRFVPGSILAGRYRIVGLLGKGGMGEVYRADDLKLGQPVALKFLPPGFDADPERLKRFLNEVRTARQVTHANVCRIYDAGEAEGHHFLSMEYVDGEDLASLLRRIGHIPKDKAIQIARQLCAGLAAAHDAGVLHRDLKPANVMIDGRGRARITDFGLAAAAEDVAGAEIQSGTPAYMAPEQLAGRGVSVRSDLYSLGLVLYELFTGKKAFTASSAGELRRAQSETTPSSPSSFMEGFDPMVERVILRCLDPDPSRRPSSAVSVAAALPGGDPLAAALAAGETPSPEMVAEAGEHGAVAPAFAWGALGVFLAAIIGVLLLLPGTSLIGMVRLDQPPEVLQERAREILRQAGHTEPRADSLYSFEPDRSYLEDLTRRKEAGTASWDELRTGPPGGVIFWYRESPGLLERILAAGVAEWMIDPPNITPGMAKIGLDPEGRLLSMVIVPGEHTDPATANADVDWAPLLRATGADEKSLTPAPPEWAPPVFADRRAAWTASWPGKPGFALRIEAASACGEPVALRVVLPWTHPNEVPSIPSSFPSRVGQILGAVIVVLVVVVAGIVALRNVRRGRGDRRGALRFALYLGAVRMLWFLGAHHVASPAETNVFMSHLAYALWRFGTAYVFYLAIEPYARRLWPQVLVSWVRVLEGRLRDPLVGRDLMIGCGAGAVGALLECLRLWIPARIGGAVAIPHWDQWMFEPLRGAVPAFVSILGVHTLELMSIVFPLTLLLIFRLLFRRTVPALIAVSIIGIVLFFPDSGSATAYLLSQAAALVVIGFALFRSGILGFATAMNVTSLIMSLPLTPRPAGWYAGATVLSLAFIVAPAAYGFWTSQSGRPLFRDDVLGPAARH